MSLADKRSSFTSSSFFISSSHCGALAGTDGQIWTVSLDEAPLSSREGLEELEISFTEFVSSG